MAKQSLLDIKNILNDYSKEIQEAISEETIRTAKEGKQSLKEASPKNKGNYARGWRVKTEKGFGYVSSTIHNATDHQLTHSLEKGHLNHNGGKVPAQPHIAKVEQDVIRTYTSNVEKIIKNGG